MIVSSGIASGLVQKVGGKALLIPGLLLFAAGMAYIDWTAHADSSRWSFLPGLIVSGFGLGFVWTPVYSLATQNLKPQLAGVAAGVLSTMQELGGVLASAAIGALLQNRLAIELHTQAVAASIHLPTPFRRQFVAGFSHAASRGFDVGRGQSGSALHLPAGIPGAIAQHIAEIARGVFTHAFAAAMRPTLILPIAVVVLAALAATAVRPVRSPAREPERVISSAAGDSTATQHSISKGR